jgi:hypothetical protein
LLIKLVIRSGNFASSRGSVSAGSLVAAGCLRPLRFVLTPQLTEPARRISLAKSRSNGERQSLSAFSLSAQEAGFQEVVDQLLAGGRQPTSSVPGTACALVAGDPGALRLLRHLRQRPTDQMVSPPDHADMEEMARAAWPPQQSAVVTLSGHARATPAADSQDRPPVWARSLDNRACLAIGLVESAEAGIGVSLP